MTRYSESWATARSQSRRLYTSWWRDRLLYMPERNGTFVLTFIENLSRHPLTTESFITLPICSASRASTTRHRLLVR